MRAHHVLGTAQKARSHHRSCQRSTNQGQSTACGSSCPGQAHHHPNQSHRSTGHSMGSLAPAQKQSGLPRPSRGHLGRGLQGHSGALHQQGNPNSRCTRQRATAQAPPAGFSPDGMGKRQAIPGPQAGGMAKGLGHGP